MKQLEVAGGNRDYIDGIEYDAGGSIAFVHADEGRALQSESILY